MGSVQFCTGVLLLALRVAPSADDLQSGLYRSSWDGKGRIVQRADTDTGGEVHLTDRLAEKLSDASLVSESNDNRRYRLSLKAGPIPDGADKQPLALVVAGLCVPVWGHSDRQADGSISLEATVMGKEAAQKIAKELGVEPQLRTHPGYELVVTAQAKQSAYRPGEVVTLVMTITNVGKTTVRFGDGGQQRGPRNNQFSFIAFRDDDRGRALLDTGDRRHMGGKMGMPTLKPGDSFTKEVALTDWFEFTEPGGYRITAIYELTLLDENHRPIWDDFAVARCVVRVAEPVPASGPSEAPATKAKRDSAAGR